MPSPTCFVVKNGSKILLSLPSGMPWPEFGDLDHHVVAAEDHGAVAVEVAAEPDVAGGDADLAAAGHGVAGVDDEVHDHLFELALVDADRGEVGCVLDAERHLVGEQAVQQVGEFGERVLEVDDGRAQGLLAREGEELADEGGGAVGVLADLHEVAVLLVGDVVAHEEQVAVAVDRGQEVVEVVGDAAGELADGLHLLGLDELGFQGLELGRVGEDGEDRGRAVEDGAGEGDLQEDLLPVDGGPGDLGAAEGAALAGVGDALGDRAAEALDQGGELDAGAGAGAEQGAGGAVGVGEAALGGEAGDGDGEFVEEEVGDEARDFGAVEGQEQEVAAAVLAGDDDGAHRRVAAREAVDAVGAERRVGEQAVEGRLAVGEGGCGGVGVEDGAAGVEAKPRHAGVAEAGERAGGGGRLDAPDEAAGGGAGDDDAAAAVGAVSGGGAGADGLGGEAGAGGLAVGQRLAAGGGVAGADAAGEVGDEDRVEVGGVETGEAFAAAAEGGEAGAEGDEVAAEDEERRREGLGDGDRTGPEAGEGRGEEQGAGAGEEGAGAVVAGSVVTGGQCPGLAVLQLLFLPLKLRLYRSGIFSTIGNVREA